MTFEFVPQAPSGALEFKRFVYNNKAEIRDKEPAKILFVETDLYYDDFIRHIGLTLLFNNTGFGNPLLHFDLIGKSRIGEYKTLDNGKIVKSEIKFKKELAPSYNFIKSLLIADGLMVKENNKAIVNDVAALKNYLECKDIILNGWALEKGHLIVEDIG